MGGDAYVLPAAMSEGMKSALSTGREPSPRQEPFEFTALGRRWRQVVRE